MTDHQNRISDHGIDFPQPNALTTTPPGHFWGELITIAMPTAYLRNALKPLYRAAGGHGSRQEIHLLVFVVLDNCFKRWHSRYTCIHFDGDACVAPRAHRP